MSRPEYVHGEGLFGCAPDTGVRLICGSAGVCGSRTPCVWGGSRRVSDSKGFVGYLFREEMDWTWSGLSTLGLSTRLDLAAAVFTVSKENTCRFLACMYINVVCRPHLSQEKIMSGVVYGC